MSKSILFLIITLNLFGIHTIAQTDSVWVIGQKMAVKINTIYNDTVEMKLMADNRMVVVSKSDIGYLIFGNGLRINYKHIAVNKMDSTFFNATIFLKTGSLFTGMINSITPQEIYYHRKNSAATKINTIDVVRILYINGLEESFDFSGYAATSPVDKKP